jgi:uncharacterized protein YybS (DUF2232 family)
MNVSGFPSRIRYVTGFKIVARRPLQVRNIFPYFKYKGETMLYWIYLVILQNLFMWNNTIKMKKGVFWDVTPCGSCKSHKSHTA